MAQKIFMSTRDQYLPTQKDQAISKKLYSCYYKYLHILIIRNEITEYTLYYLPQNKYLYYCMLIKDIYYINGKA